MYKAMKKKTYISPDTSIVPLCQDALMDNAVSWTDPDGNHHRIIDGDPSEEEAKRNTFWGNHRSVWDDQSWGESNDIWKGWD